MTQPTLLYNKDARFLKPKVIMCCDYINITMEIVQRLKKIS